MDMKISPLMTLVCSILLDIQLSPCLEWARNKVGPMLWGGNPECVVDSRCHEALFQAVSEEVGGQPDEGLNSFVLHLSYVIRIEHQAQRRRLL